MPQLFASAQAAQPQQAFPEEQYNQWRSQKMAQWIQNMAHIHSQAGAISTPQAGAGQPIPKLHAALKFFQEDSPELRQMFQQEVQQR